MLSELFCCYNVHLEPADTELARVQRASRRITAQYKSTASEAVNTVIARAPLIAVSAFICDVGRTFHFDEFIRYKTYYVRVLSILK